MIALSIRQPWASLIILPGVKDAAQRAELLAEGVFKDIENRDWPTQRRGRILVHASKGCTRAEFEDGLEFAEIVTGCELNGDIKTTPRGGIIGSVEIVDCVTESDSPWFVGKYGFVLRNPQPLPFHPCKGQLGFFDVPEWKENTGGAA